MEDTQPLTEPIITPVQSKNFEAFPGDWDPGDSSRDLFGMVSSRDPFEGWKVTSNVWGSKGHFESPGSDFFHLFFFEFGSDFFVGEFFAVGFCFSIWLDFSLGDGNWLDKDCWLGEERWYWRFVDGYMSEWIPCLKPTKTLEKWWLGDYFPFGKAYF